MLAAASAPAADELKVKRKVLVKARKMSKIYKDDSATGSPSGSFTSLLAKINEMVTEGGTSTAAGSLSPKTSHNTRPSSAISGSSAVEGSIVSEASGPAPSTTGSAEQLPRKASRLSRQSVDDENIPPPTKRQSLDFASRGTAGSARGLKRSRSLWAHEHQPQQVSDDAAAGFQDRYMQNFGTMSERQKALNVKRARKMTQLFGQEPPPELIQIQDDREDARDSMAFSALLTVTPLRDRANSTSTAGDDNEGPGSDELPSDPPPFSTSYTVEDREVGPSDTFQDRRRRAAKLSRFFGVGFQDITMLPEVAPPIPRPQAEAEVDIKVGGGRRFWSFGDRPKESDMQEAIHKLRGLKAG